MNPTDQTRNGNSSGSVTLRRSLLQSELCSPRDETEKLVAHAWACALEIDEVGVNDDFFDLGGHSLIAFQITTELGKVFQIHLPVRALFDAPTVAGLAARIRVQLIAEIQALSEEQVQRRGSGE